MVEPATRVVLVTTELALLDDCFPTLFHFTPAACSLGVQSKGAGTFEGPIGTRLRMHNTLYHRQMSRYFPRVTHTGKSALPALQERAHPAHCSMESRNVWNQNGPRKGFLCLSTCCELNGRFHHFLCKALLIMRKGTQSLTPNWSINNENGLCASCLLSNYPKAGIESRFFASLPEWQGMNR